MQEQVHELVVRKNGEGAAQQKPNTCGWRILVLRTSVLRSFARSLVALSALFALGGLGCEQSTPLSASEMPLRILIDGPAEALDPRMVFETQGLRVSRLLFASLVTIDPESLEVVPQLASSVTVEDGVHYRVRLRDGLRFSDGSALDADDVIATFQSIVDARLKSRYAASYARITRMVRVNDVEVVFTIDAPHAPFLTDLEFPILRAEDTRTLWSMQTDTPTAAFAESSGPYVLTHWSRGLIELAPNPHWQGARRRAEHVRFIAIESDNTRAMRLLAGEGDILAAVPSTLLPLFEGHDELVVRSAPGINTTYLGINTAHAPLQGLDTRHALASAIDKRKLILARLEGHGAVASSWIPPNHWAVSRGQLEESTTEENRETPLPDSELVLRTTSDHPRIATARAIAAMLEDRGARVRVRPSEKQTLLSDLSKGRFDLALLSVPEVIEPHVLAWFFSSERIPGGNQVGANRWRFSSQKLDDAFRRGVQSTDLSRRAEAYAEVQRELARGLPVIPLWHEDVTLVVRRKYVDVQVPRHGRYDFLLEH